MRIIQSDQSFDVTAKQLGHLHVRGGAVVLRLRKNAVTGPWLVAQENPDQFISGKSLTNTRSRDDSEYSQDGYINGSVNIFLVKLADGYRGTIEEDDKFAVQKAHLVLGNEGSQE